MGVMLTPRGGVRPELAAAAPVWAADSGCYAQGDRFVLGDYLVWLDGMRPAAGTCLFAPAPDVVGDAAATWARSRDVLPQLRALGYRAALVAQDGIGAVDWAAIDVLFIGGVDCSACRTRKSAPGMNPIAGAPRCTCFKWSPQVEALCAEARARGVHAHIGRVNSRRRLRHAAAIGADSADGSYAALNPDEALTRMGGEAAWLRAQGRLL